MGGYCFVALRIVRSLRFENRYLKAEIGDRVSFDTVMHSCKLGGVTFLVTITPCVLSSGTHGKQEMEIIKVAIGAYDPKRSPFDRGFYIGSIAFQSLRFAYFLHCDRSKKMRNCVIDTNITLLF